jgi:hypothetical protein
VTCTGDCRVECHETGNCNVHCSTGNATQTAPGVFTCP